MNKQSKTIAAVFIAVGFVLASLGVSRAGSLYNAGTHTYFVIQKDGVGTVQRNSTSFTFTNGAPAKEPAKMIAFTSAARSDKAYLELRLEFTDPTTSKQVEASLDVTVVAFSNTQEKTVKKDSVVVMSSIPVRFEFDPSDIFPWGADTTRVAVRVDLDSKLVKQGKAIDFTGPYYGYRFGFISGATPPVFGNSAALDWF